MSRYDDIEEFEPDLKGAGLRAFLPWRVRR